MYVSGAFGLFRVSFIVVFSYLVRAFFIYFMLSLFSSFVLYVGLYFVR